MSDAQIDRRLLLKVLCASTGAICGGAVGCGGPEPVKADELTKLPAALEGKLVIAIKDFPALMKVGGGLVGAADGVADPVAIMRETEESFAVVSGVCTHMKCVLRYNQLNATLDCPCHGSTFEGDGRVINGPATQPLARLTTEFDGTTLGIKLGG